MKEMVGGCCVCSDDRGWPENPLVYCDGQSCTVAVHQACYGIVTVPTGPWYCRKCESQERTARVKCELCPSKYGALKRTDNSGWAHVVCALYIPEVRFGNVTTMEPIQLQLIPTERFSKVCYICEEQNKPSNATVGACMQCNKSGCKQQFHVTCAQTLGLLCEEAGNYLDNVKYCGYCQHHYSKLKKGGNVKTIPPYKPVSTENHHSDSPQSEKEAVKTPNNSPNLKITPPPPAVAGKRSKSSTTRASSTKSSSSAVKPTTSHPKTSHNNNSNSTKSDKDKPKIVKSAKTEDNSTTVLNSSDETLTTDIESVKEIKTELEIVETPKTEIIKELKTGKKRKNNSRTPTPLTGPPIIENSTVIPAANLSVVIPELSASVLSGIANSGSIETRERVDTTSSASPEKIRKLVVKSETVTPSTTPAIVSSPSPTPVVKSPSPVLAPLPIDQESVLTTPTVITPPAAQSPTVVPSISTLAVSVPLTNSNLSPPTSTSNQASVVTPESLYQQDFSTGSLSNSPISTSPALETPGLSTSSISTSEMSGGGLKIVYEKQSGVSSSPESTVPAKRSRSMSGEKNEKGGRGKRRINNIQQNPTNRRASRSQHVVTPPPQPSSIIPINQIKESPPSSPSSESQGPPTTRSAKAKRKSAPATVTSSTSGSNSKDTKENIKVYQNGLTAPHMLGNQLNPNSRMAQKMTDHLNSEIEAHSIYNNSNDQANLIGPQLHHRVIANARSSSTGGSSTASGASGFSMLGGSGGIIPQTLDQLLERQWEQGSQFLMEQAQHFDIASLLSCLHQLRAENLRLEEHVSTLLQRRDHLLAVNARLAIPLTGQPATPHSSHPHTVNNIHPAVVANHGDLQRPRHNNTFSHMQVPSHHAPPPLENGLSSESSQGYPHHRSPVNNQSQSSNSSYRHSPAGTTGYPSSGLIRHAGGENGGIAPRPQSYQIFQGPATPTPQSQMVTRRDSDFSQTSTTKPS